MSRIPMQHPTVLVTGPGERPPVPTWIPPSSDLQVASESEVRHLSRLPELTIVRATKLHSILARTNLLATLASRLDQTPEPSKIVFAFRASTAKPNPEALCRVLTYFHRSDDVEFAWGAQQAASTMSEAFAKICAQLLRATDARSPSDPLGRVKSVIAATADLHAESGRLSAQKVANAFSLSLAELASLIGRSRQTLWKTDDAEAAQTSLLPFERIARLRAVLSEDDFRNWLNMSNDELDERTPIDVIRDGRIDVVADLAADMLTGSPA